MQDESVLSSESQAVFCSAIRPHLYLSIQTATPLACCVWEIRYMLKFLLELFKYLVIEVLILI